MKLINPNDIRFAMVPIAPFLVGDSVHYEWIAFREEVNQIPMIEAEPVKHAHVVWTKPNISYQTQCCSNCHRTFISRPDETIQFCPHCGAKMKGENCNDND